MYKCHPPSPSSIFDFRTIILFMASSSMKLHQFTHGLIWPNHESSSVFKCLRPLAPKIHDSTTTTTTIAPFDLKRFILPNSDTGKLISSEEKKVPNQVETHPGGTRWNPTQEQIGILEMLYRGGMRTPNAQQIEQITMQLSKYGKIEGKNVFYWFQNHKARERQKQKRTSLGLTNHFNPKSNSTFSSTLTLNSRGEVDQREEESPYKRSCMSWSFESTAGDVTKGYNCKNREEDHDRTLELFPLHPEGRSC